MVPDPRPSSAEPSEPEGPTELIPEAEERTREMPPTNNPPAAPGTTNTGSWSLAPARWPDGRDGGDGGAGGAAPAQPEAEPDDGESTQAWSAPLQPAEPAGPAPTAPTAPPAPSAQPAQPAGSRAASSVGSTAMPPAQPRGSHAASSAGSAAGSPAQPRGSHAASSAGSAAASPAGTTPPTDSVPTAQYYRPPVGPPSRVYVPRPVVTEPLSQAIPMAPPPPPPARRRARGWLYSLATLVVVAVIAGVGLYALNSRDGGSPAAPTNNTSTEAATFEAALTTFTTQGTGFRASGDLWVTQTYRTPEFGGLKPGVGLVLDLGKAQRVIEVDFTARTGPLTVELRSADTLPTALKGWHPEGSAKQATGATVLPVASTKRHRYWMIWVTRLGADTRAVVGDVKARGTT